MNDYWILMDGQFGFMPDLGLSSVEPYGFAPYPTDIHTDVDVSFYDEQIENSRNSFIDASEDLVNAQGIDEIERAIEQSKQAQADIDYWNHCRTQSEYDQTIDNIKTDQIINECNKALNDLHNTLNGIPQSVHTDYSDDIFVQGMDWDKIAQQTFGNL